MRSVIKELEHLLDLLETIDTEEYNKTIAQLEKLEDALNDILGR